MKKKWSKRMAILPCLFFLFVTPSFGGGRGEASIIGTWVLVAMKYDGEDKKALDNTYTCVKYYGPTGEYACAEIIGKGTDCSIVGHEYGTYTYHNGLYTECGRKSKFVMYGKGYAWGRWSNRIEYWKKVALPKDLVNEIVLRCKATRPLSKEMKQNVRRYLLKR